MNKILIVFMLIGCHSAYKKQDKIFISECVSKWHYRDLEATNTLKVLLFSPKHRVDLTDFPNLIIAVNNNGDTSAYIDILFNGNIKRGQIISVERNQWSQNEKDLHRLSMSSSSDNKTNRLFCSVDTVYYSKIVLPIQR